MKRDQRAYYDWIAQHACVRCGRRPVEVAHVRAFRSPKTGDRLPRRKGINAWAVLPLCADCHRTGPHAIHAMGEGGFEFDLGRGSGYLAEMAGSLLAEWVTT
jgi:hypothetical protein